jgi:hypothetical protein
MVRCRHGTQLHSTYWSSSSMDPLTREKRRDVGNFSNAVFLVHVLSWGPGLTRTVIISHQHHWGLGSRAQQPSQPRGGCRPHSEVRPAVREGLGARAGGGAGEPGGVG